MAAAAAAPEEKAAPKADRGPPPQLVIRRREGWQFYLTDREHGGRVAADSPLVPATNPCVFSPCGRYLANVTAEAVVIWDTHSQGVHTTLARPGVASAFFSPRGSFLVTFEPQGKADERQPNLLVWLLGAAAAAPELRLAVHQKEFHPNTYGYGRRRFVGRTSVVLSR
jgi:hypothetical protein